MISRLEYPLDHASHLPILIGVGASFPTHTVVEYGAGLYSTPLFLNKCAFPKVEKVVSVELDEAWAWKTIDAFGNDPRLNVIGHEPIGLTNGVDLVFVDNGPREHKATTIEQLSRYNVSSIVVVHDAEVGLYLNEISKFRTKFVFENYHPATAICYNGFMPEKIEKAFWMIDIVIKRHSFPVDNIGAWIEVFNG
jgi:hypothetical protein